jgi:uncharacterized protein GlcG (DUF336 family)
MYTRTTLGLEEATKATEAIIKYVQANKERPVSIAVVDDRGELVLFTRMDGAPLNTVNMSIIKAYTSARRRRDTKTIREFHANTILIIMTGGIIDSPRSPAAWS